MNPQAPPATGESIPDAQLAALYGELDAAYKFIQAAVPIVIRALVTAQVDFEEQWFFWDAVQTLEKYTDVLSPEGLLVDVEERREGLLLGREALEERLRERQK